MSEVTTRQQIWKDMFGSVLEKGAELANTYDMPASPPPSKVKEKPGGEKSVIDKTASVVSDDEMLKHAFRLETNEEGIAEENPSALPQAKSLKPHIDVKDKDPVEPTREKKAQYYACPSFRRYPLDGYDQIIKAASYFDEYWKHMEPEIRHEYCCNLVKRASAVGIKVSPLVARYGAETYAPPDQIKIALDARRTLLQNEVDAGVLDKLAEIQAVTSPELFAEILSEFDRRNFLDQYYGDIPDPYFSTFDKRAEDRVTTESDASANDAIVIGNEYLPLDKLFELSKRGYDAVWKRFGKDVADAFSQDPKGIFDSLPRDQKLVIMRMAGSNASQLHGATTS